MATQFLAEARKALWHAINNWEPLMTGGESELVKKYTFDDSSTMLTGMQPTSWTELPALAIFPLDMTPKEFLQQQQFFPYPLQLHFWTKDWVLPLAETLWEHLVDAAYQCKHLPTSDTVPVVKKVTGYYPRIGVLSFKRVQLGKEQKSERAIYGTFTLILRQPFSPYQ